MESPASEKDRGSLPDARHQLWFDHFRELGVFALALAGGILTLLGTVFSQIPNRRAPLLSMVAAGLAAGLALYGQVTIVDKADKGQPPGKPERRLRMAVFALISAAFGAFLAFAVDALSTAPPVQ